MSKTSVDEAQNNFSHLIDMAETGEHIELIKNDKPVAVLISYEEYEKKFSPCWFKTWRETHAKTMDNEGIPQAPKMFPNLMRKIFEK